MKKRAEVENKYLKWMEFTQLVITYYKEWTPLDIDMLLYIMEKAISWDVNNIFRRSLCIWTINLMSFIDLQQTVFQFPLKRDFFKIFNLFIDWVPHFCACVFNAKFFIVGSYLQETKRQFDASLVL